MQEEKETRVKLLVLPPLPPPVVAIEGDVSLVGNRRRMRRRGW